MSTVFSSRERAVLAIVLVTTLMVVIDVSIVVTALPNLARALAFTQAELSWVQSLYTLTFGGFLLVGARAGDLIGRRRMFEIGLGLFCLSSLAIALSQGPMWMISFRAIQGIGGAILAPTSLALMSSTFPDGEARDRAMSIYGSAVGLAASIGLVLGGIFAALLSWRVGFFINLPIGIALFVMVRRTLQDKKIAGTQLDLMGAVLSTLGIGLIVWGIVHAGETSWTDTATDASLVLGAVLFGWFLRHEARTASPILSLRVFSDTTRSASYVARFCFLAAMVAFFFFASEHMQLNYGFSALQAGMGFLPMTVVNFFVALRCASVVRRIGNGRTTFIGVALTLACMVWIALGATQDLSWTVGIGMPLVLAGVGQGLCYGPLTTLGMRNLHPDDVSAASGLINVLGQIGGAVGVGVLTSAMLSLGDGAADFGVTFTGSALFLAIACLASLWLIERRARVTS